MKKKILKQKKPKRIRKRNEKRKKIIKYKEINFFGINAAGIKSKLKSFNEVLMRIKPKIWFVQETKLKPQEEIICEAVNNFQVFYLNRHDSQGGGLAIGVVKDFESTLLREGNDEVEAISIKIGAGKLSIRTVLAYGPQENSKKEKKDMLWEFLEQEVNQAKLDEDGLVIQLDGNLHAGMEVIKNDPNIQNKNGKLFFNFLKRNPSLVVVNALSLCEGLITRRRELEEKTEEAVLDFFIINERMLLYLKRMIIDEDKNYTLSNFAQKRKNGKVIETDHNALIMELNIEVIQKKPERIELLNLKNKQCQEAFKEETDTNSQLVECFDDGLPVEEQCKNWFRNFNDILHKNFRKIRVVNNRKKVESDETGGLIKERIDLKKEAKANNIDVEMKEKIMNRIDQIENDIGDKIAKEFHQEVINTLDQLGGEVEALTGSGRQTMWKILKKKYPKTTPVIPVGKRDRKGNMISNHLGLKHLYLETYMHRLRNRPMKNDLQNIKDLKMKLFNLRLEIAKRCHTKPWTLTQLEKALKSLKSNKARDPLGWANEIFKEGVAGQKLKESLLKMFNKIKDNDHIPDFMELADIATIYKGKGEKCKLDNDRGIFIVTILRCVLMKLIYMEEYEGLDNSMSDSQIGARKSKNIRNHIWVVNGVICDVLSQKNKKAIDVQIMDYKQCFDSLWIEECLNDFYDGGLQNEKLALLYSVNKM